MPVINPEALGFRELAGLTCSAPAVLHNQTKTLRAVWNSTQPGALFIVRVDASIRPYSLLASAQYKLALGICVHSQGVPCRVGAADDLLCDHRFDVSLDVPLQGACTVNRVIAAVDDGILGRIGNDQIQLLVGQALAQVGQHQVTVRGESVFFPLKEFELLEYLMQNKGRVMTRHQLIDRIWGSDYVGDTKTLDVHVKRVRSKIEEDPAHPQYLTTVRGLGYKIDSPQQ